MGPAPPPPPPASPQPKLVSICMPVYNGEDLLEETLEMLLRQDYANLEIVVRDDASTDSTPRILQEYSERDSRIRVTRNPRNLGMWRNIIAAFDDARGDYWMIAAHDDLFDPTLVSALVDELEKNPDAAMAFCEIGIVSYDGKPIETKYENLPYSFWSLGKDAMYRLYLDPKYRIDGTLNSSMFRRGALERAFAYVRAQRKIAGGTDGIIPLYCLQLGDLIIHHERLFFRRLKAQAPTRSSEPQERKKQGSLLLTAFVRAAKSAVSYQVNHWYHIRRCFPLRQLSLRTRIWVERRLMVIHFRKMLGVYRTLKTENLARYARGA